MRSKVSSSTSSIGRRECVVPALLTRMSSRPKRSRLDATRRPTSSPRDTSGLDEERVPPRLADRARDAAAVLRVDVGDDDGRASARRTGRRCPPRSPTPPPVTIATLPSRSIMLPLPPLAPSRLPAPLDGGSSCGMRACSRWARMTARAPSASRASMQARMRRCSLAHGPAPVESDRTGRGGARGSRRGRCRIRCSAPPRTGACWRSPPRPPRERRSLR